MLGFPGGFRNNNNNNNENLARQLQAQFNREAAAIQAAHRANGGALPVAVVNGLRPNARVANNNAANMRMAIAVAKKLVLAKRALVGAGRAAARGSVLLAKKISEKAERLAREAYELAPERKVVKDYARNLMQKAKGIFSATRNTIIQRGRNILARYARVPNRVANRQANARPLARAPSNRNANVNAALNRIGVNRLAVRNNVLTLSRSNQNLILSLSDNVPEFFMIKKIIEALSNMKNIAESRRSQLLKRIPQYLRIMRYYRQIDAHVSRMRMPNLAELQSFNRQVGRGNISDPISNIKEYAQPIIGTLIHYENIWEVIGDAYGFYGPGRPRITETRRATESVDLVKSFMERLKEQIHQSALAFRDVYNRAGDPNQVVISFTRELANENWGTPCIDAGVRVLYEVSQKIQRNYPNNARRAAVPNANRWKGLEYSIVTNNGRLTNNGKTILNLVLNNHASRLPQQILSDKNLVWNSIKNKNLKINGRTRKIVNIPTAKNWVNNWYRAQ